MKLNLAANLILLSSIAEDVSPAKINRLLQFSLYNGILKKYIKNLAYGMYYLKIYLKKWIHKILILPLSFNREKIYKSVDCLS